MLFREIKLLSGWLEKETVALVEVKIGGPAVEGGRFVLELMVDGVFLSLKVPNAATFG